MDLAKRYSDVATKSSDGVPFAISGLGFYYTGDFVTHEITQNDDLPYISYLFYDNPEYWWVVALANDIINPLSLNQGDVLKIPSDLDQVVEYLNGVSNA